MLCNVDFVGNQTDGGTQWQTNSIRLCIVKGFYGKGPGVCESWKNNCLILLKLYFEWKIWLAWSFSVLLRYKLVGQLQTKVITRPQQDHDCKRTNWMRVGFEPMYCIGILSNCIFFHLINSILFVTVFYDICKMEYLKINRKSILLSRLI